MKSGSSHNKEKLRTCDSSSDNLDWFDRWSEVSYMIVVGGFILGGVANLLLGREFKTSDPYIGPLLMPFMLLWIGAFFHVTYVGLRGRLSAPVRWLCYIFFLIVVGLLLLILFK